MLLLGARLWLAGLLRRVGPTPLVCLPISRAQWRQRNLAPAESQPRLLAASQVRPTCPCAEAGFLYRVLSTDTLDQIRRTLPGVWVWGGGCHFPLPGTGMSPTLPASQARQRFSGEVPRTSAFLGPVFSLDPCGSYFSATGLPAYPLASPLSLLASDGKRSEGWVVHNIELSQARAPLAAVEER